MRGLVVVFSKKLVNKLDINRSIGKLFHWVKVLGCDVKSVIEPGDIVTYVKAAVEILTDAGFETELIKVKEADNFSKADEPVYIVGDKNMYKVKITKDAVYKHLLNTYRALMKTLETTVLDYSFDEYVKGTPVLDISNGFGMAFGNLNDTLVFDYDKESVCGLTDFVRNLYNKMSEAEEEWYYLVGVYCYRI